MKKWIFWCFMMVYVVSLQAEENIVAYVNDEVVTEKDLKDQINLNYRWRQMSQNLEANFQGQELIKRRNNLKVKVLETIITDKLIATEAKKLFSELPKSVIREQITNRITTAGANSEQDLKNILKLQNKSWEKFLEEISDHIRIEQYKFIKVNKRIKVSPKQAYRLYVEHKKKKTNPTRTDEYGTKLVVPMQVPEAVHVLQLNVMPDLSKGLLAGDLDALGTSALKVVTDFDKVKDQTEAELKTWIAAQQKKYNKLTITLSHRGVFKNEKFSNQITDFAFKKENLNKWQKAIKTLENTDQRGVKIQRWDRVKVVGRKKAFTRPYSEVRKDLEKFLKDTAFEQEMKILRERLWKRGGVKVLISNQ